MSIANSKQPVEDLSNASLLWQLATRKKQPLSEFVPSSLYFSDVKPDAAKQDQFRGMFAGKGQQPLLPSFMFIVGFRYLAQLLAQARMPSNLIGLIHLSTKFTVHKPHHWQNNVDIEVSIESYTHTAKGINYLLVTKFYQHGELTLRNENVVLDKAGNYRSKVAQLSPAKQNDRAALASNQIDLSTARAYAKLSGDFNFIHLHHSLAKLFGLKAAIIHGMYNVHWSLSQLNRSTLEHATAIEIDFNRPCFLPNLTQLVELSEANQQRSYGLFSEDFNDRFLKLVIKSLP